MSNPHSSAEKRRLPRFHITPCQYLDRDLGRAVAVQDISNGGMALRLVDKADLAEFTVGRVRKGTVKVEGLKTDCEIQVRFVKGSLVGTEWVNPSRELIEHIDQISGSDKLGEHLKSYPLEEVAGTSWYHNPVGVDLLIYRPDPAGEFKRWTLFIHQSFVQWDRDDELQTGHAVAEDEEGYAHGLVRLETRMIDYDPAPNMRLVESAIEILKSALAHQRITDADAAKFLQKTIEREA